MEIGIHGVSFYLVGLKEKKIDNDKNRKGQNDHLDRVQNELPDFLQDRNHIFQSYLLFYNHCNLGI